MCVYVWVCVTLTPDTASSFQLLLSDHLMLDKEKERKLLGESVLGRKYQLVVLSQGVCISPYSRYIHTHKTLKLVVK